ncbi:MAG: DMT family transporter, partial [Chloroflexi bacterium]|nr:DMT family transporter [Chloroflexota bacterium]
MTLSALGELLLLGAIWGASFLFIKIGVSDIRPLTFATLRVLVGAAVLLGVIAMRKLPLPRGKPLWGRLAVMGAVGIVIPFGAIAWGTQYIASGLSAILNATMPLFTFGLAVLLGDEPLSLRRVLGLVVGFLGIMVLTWPKLQAGIRSEVWGQVAVIVASLSYAAAILYAKRYLAQEPPLLTAFGQVSMGCVLLVPLALAELPWQQTFTPRVIGSALAIGV